MFYEDCVIYDWKENVGTPNRGSKFAARLDAGTYSVTKQALK